MRNHKQSPFYRNIATYIVKLKALPHAKRLAQARVQVLTHALTLALTKALILALELALTMVLLLPPSCEAVEVTSPFGWRIHPISGEFSFHTGIDLGYDYNTPIPAMRSGTVVYAAVYGGYGNCIILEHPDGDHTLYAHCSDFAVSYGDTVKKGQAIAYVGSSGISTGPHLHLEWWHKGHYVDPLGLWNYDEEDNGKSN